MKIFKFFFVINLFFSSIYAFGQDNEFNAWKEKFKIYAEKQGISKKILNETIEKSIFLPDVIKYDRYQPEFYEDTKTYISKRTSKSKVKKGIKLYSQNNNLIDKVSKIYKVDKNLLLSLMGIETNFGTYLGKMDIISSLATLSYDKRRSEFFSSELITILKLLDQKIVDKNTLYGSWAGAYGNFQFMPSTIKSYAVDYNQNKKIELKKLEDSFASAANYLNSLGWDNKKPCFYKINLVENVPLNYLNTSAKKLKNKKKIKYLKKYIKNSKFLNKYDDIKGALITPDVDIIPDTNKFEPAYIVFDNYELILKWNRSLRFALAVCTLKEKFNNDL